MLIVSIVFLLSPLLPRSEINFFPFFFIVDEAVDIAFGAIFSNHGQNCCAGSRTFVQDKVHDEFVKRATAKAAARKVGDPFAPGTEQGPQVRCSQLGFQLSGMSQVRKVRKKKAVRKVRKSQGK